jgi:hypothetical protein
MSGVKRQAPHLHYEILKLLGSGQNLSLSDIRSGLPSIVCFSDADKARNSKRPNEPKWYSDLSNRLQKSRSGSLVAKGFVEAVGIDNYRITDAGREELQSWERLLETISDLSLVENT